MKKLLIIPLFLIIASLLSGGKHQQQTKHLSILAMAKDLPDSVQSLVKIIVVKDTVINYKLETIKTKQK
jgi:hypothetical protein